MGYVCLGSPIARGNSCCGTADCNDNELLLEDIVAQTECIRVEVEITLGWRVITSLVGWPCHIRIPRSWLTPLRFAHIIIGRRIGPQVATVWFRLIANETRLTTPSPVRLRIIRLPKSGRNSARGEASCDRFRDGRGDGNR